MSPIVSYIQSELSGLFSGDELRDLTMWIAEETSGLSRTELIVGKDTTFFSNNKIDSIIERLKKGEPLAYIVGYCDWRGLRLRLNHSTLIPRPETAQLVDLVTNSHSQQRLRVVDWCTGSGCIALSLKRERPQWDVIGLDISTDAIDMARANASDNDIDVSFEVADMLSDVSRYEADIIVCNPPYIMPSERQTMTASVLDWEPSAALFVPEHSPLLFYRTLAEAHTCRQMFFEINPLLATDMVTMLEDMGWGDIHIFNDYAGKQRFVCATTKL